MISAWILGVSLAIGVAAVFFSAQAERPELHMGLTALVCLGFAVAAVLERRGLAKRGASEAALAASTATSMALVWGWAAFSLLLTYVFVLSWIEWWQYVLGAGAVAALCLFFAATLSRDAATGREDQTMLKLARYLTLGQLVGMVAAMIGLFLDDKMPRSPEKADWAASTIFFFGAASLAVISLNALRGTPSQQS
jgi:4-hydroxybenzoate polyprenyltransferase